ncbi:MAG TPA: class I SAM-dependent methyltransferase [Bdellovibrionota bacterium]|jgi:hypothetical protein|nr:class I SAM-dependent methyltransferase [Bdellovibrionota bacterium]
MLESYVSVDLQWLQVRFPFDHACRDRVVLRALQHLVAERISAHGRAGRPLKVVDLGAGSGANVAHLARALGGWQDWLLVDRDPRVLEGAQSFLEWAFHSASLRPAPGAIRHQGVNLDFREVDYRGADLVTANAVFDLNAEDEFEALLARIEEVDVSARPALYFTTHLSGRSEFDPIEDDDAFFAGLFSEHMERPQSFGRGMGIACAARMREILSRRGWQVTEGASDWIATAEDRAFLRANLRFIEEAVRQVSEWKDVDPARLERWHRTLQERESNGTLRLRVPHADFLAAWPR